AAIAQNTQDHSKRRVAYYYDANIGNYYYGAEHVMKPHRIRMTHHLILNYGLYLDLQVYRPFPADYDDMTRFHSEEYVTYLKKSVPSDMNMLDMQMVKFNFNKDCPVFDGLYEFCQLSTGGSLAGAVKLNLKKSDIAINWMGGLHHAKKGQASGFCYTNDIVLGILELLKHHKRVLYVDIDVHHGDGVEEAFYTTDRVMTVSFHKYGQFFPGTGGLKDLGAGKGRYYSLNVPLKDGITDDSYQGIFKPVMTKVMERFQPDAVVLQCGADSLNGDRLGPFNLTLRGHGECVSFLRSYNVPLMMLGGGGYTPRNVARCWTYETALAVGKQLHDELPYNDYFDYFGPNYRLHIGARQEKNENTTEYLKKVQSMVLANLENLPFVPSVQMQPVPGDAITCLSDSSFARDMANPDSRLHPSIMDGVTQDQGEFYDGETEGDDRKNEYNAKRAAENGKENDAKRPRIDE
ncbi:hypothetical protein PFISCL1PPCAC_13029, partial [Pristionchus fissidentatus]